MKNKFLILIYGPLCAGKSTVIRIFMEKYPGLFHASTDNIKWFISDYSTHTYGKTGMVHRLLLALINQAAAEGLSIIAEGNTGLMRLQHHYRELAEKHHMKFTQVNMEAPYELLLDRFRARVRMTEEQDTRISFKEDQEYKLRYDGYMKNKNKELPTFDTSEVSLEEVVKEIERLIH